MARRIDIKVCRKGGSIEIIEYYQKSREEVYRKGGCNMSGAAARTGDFNKKQRVKRRIKRDGRCDREHAKQCTNKTDIKNT